MRLVLLLACSLAAGGLLAQAFPALSGRVVDQAKLLGAGAQSTLDARLAALETQTGRQFVVATVSGLQGYSIEDFGYRLGREWGIGRKQENDGVILLVAPNEKKVRIEVGYGLEGILTDALSSTIIQGAILPRFRKDDFPGGIQAGADAIIAQLELPEDQAREVAAKAAEQSEGGSAMFFFAVLLMAALYIFNVRLSRSSRHRRRGTRRHGSTGPIIIWGGGSGGGFGGGGGGFGGGGGGFGGGGGGFGGGGASGGW